MQIQNLSSNSDSHAFPYISAKTAVGEILSIKEPILLGKWLIWLEQRPHESGRTTALIRSIDDNDLAGQELTPAPLNLRSRVHVYGGGVLAASINDGELILTWIDDLNSCLCSQTFLLFSDKKNQINQWARPSKKLMYLSIKNKYNLGGGLIDIKRKRWIGFLEKNEKDFLVSFSLNKENQEPKFLHSALDFGGYISINSEADQIAWIQWQQPNMPWDSSELWWALFNDDGDIKVKRNIAGGVNKNNREISVFQPQWLDSGELIVSEDSNGWWNLIITDKYIEGHSFPQWKRMWTMQSESAAPQWTYGMSTASSTNGKIIAANCRNGIWKLNLFSLDGSISEINQPFNELSYVQADQGRVVAVASSPVESSGLLEINLKLGTYKHTANATFKLDKKHISQPEEICFTGFKGKKTYAWYYPPIAKKKSGTPLLVKSHSGPTAMAGTGLDLSIQFWTSRGWGVVDVNYGGSSGFGREYRDRIRNSWGLVDVFDCELAAKALIARGQVDKNLIAIEGGSAGGFTTLSCLCSSDIFSVAACRYAVSDLTTLPQETHRFEKGYFEYLIGSYNNNFDIYESRSPLHKIDQIKCPIIFFQGLKDNVVPPSQTNKISQALRNNNIKVEVHTYKNEGHGFKDSLVKIDVLEKTETFFNQYLDL